MTSAFLSPAENLQQFTTNFLDFIFMKPKSKSKATKSFCYIFEMLERYFVKTYKTYNAETKDAHMTRYYHIKLCRWNLCDFLLLLPGISKCRRNFLWFRGKESRSSAPLAIPLQIFQIFYIYYIYGSNSYVEEKNSGQLHHWLFLLKLTFSTNVQI